MEKIVIDPTMTTSTVVQTLLYNLIAIAENAESEDSLRDTLLQVSSAIPGRNILISSRSDTENEQEPNVLCSIAPDGKRTFCGDYIQIPSDNYDQMIARVIGLLIPDVPVYVWLVQDISLQQKYTWLSSLTDYVITDDFTYNLTADNHAVISMPWLRLRPWFEAIARVFDSSDVLEAAAGLKKIHLISSKQHSNTSPASAWLLAIWMIYCLKGMYVNAELTESGIILQSGINDQPVVIEMDHKHLFDTIEFKFDSESSEYIRISQEEMQFNIESIIGKHHNTNHIHRLSDAELLVDEISGRDSALLYAKILNTMKEYKLC